MTQKQIQQAFNNHWKAIVQHQNLSISYIKGVKELCHDFFQAGVTLAASTTDQPPADTTISLQDFDHWWNLYDKKRGREKCLQKWQKLSDREKQACIAATPDYVAATPDKQFRKDPQTYLNNKSWNDEIINNNKNQQRQQRLNDAAELIAKYAG